MKAFVMDDENTVYAALDKDAAIAKYIEDSGCKLDDFEDYIYELSDDVLDKEIDDYDENEQPTGKKTTMRSWLNEMTEAGYMCGGRG
jgi:hypothetical protein